MTNLNEQATEALLAYESAVRVLTAAENRASAATRAALRATVEDDVSALDRAADAADAHLAAVQQIHAEAAIALAELVAEGGKVLA